MTENYNGNVDWWFENPDKMNVSEISIRVIESVMERLEHLEDIDKFNVGFLMSMAYESGRQDVIDNIDEIFNVNGKSKS